MCGDGVGQRSFVSPTKSDQK